MTPEPSPDFKRTKVLACATVIEEMLPLMPADMTHEVLDFGLHLVPNNLKKTLQAAIDATDPEYDTIILGYGLCSMAVVGLQANHCRLVIPRVDDCIAIFLGSHEAYKVQAKQAPGTYYLTKGWIEVSDTPFEEYTRMVEQYGVERADRIMKTMLKHYTRLVYIDTGVANQEYYREYTRKTAEKFNLRFEEITGSNELIKRTLFGPWDGDFVVVEPGQTITYLDFKTGEPAADNPASDGSQETGA